MAVYKTVSMSRMLKLSEISWMWMVMTSQLQSQAGIGLCESPDFSASELIIAAKAWHCRKRPVYWGVAHTFLFRQQHFVGLRMPTGLG